MVALSPAKYATGSAGIIWLIVNVIIINPSKVGKNHINLLKSMLVFSL